eukprot:5126971-Amphidinium_carterae.1
MLIKTAALDGSSHKNVTKHAHAQTNSKHAYHPKQTPHNTQQAVEDKVVPYTALCTLSIKTTGLQ